MAMCRRLCFAKRHKYSHISGLIPVMAKVKANSELSICFCFLIDNSLICIILQ